MNNGGYHSFVHPSLIDNDEAQRNVASTSRKGLFSRFFPKKTSRPPSIPELDNEDLPADLPDGEAEEEDVAGRVSALVQGVIGNVSRDKYESDCSTSTGGDLADYNQSVHRQHWMPDSRSAECSECALRFTTFRRKHHCRICGQIFCSRCCSHLVPGHWLGYVGELRLCTNCCRAVVTYMDNLSNVPVAAKALLHSLKRSLIDSPSAINLRKQSVGGSVSMPPQSSSTAPIDMNQSVLSPIQPVFITGSLSDTEITNPRKQSAFDRVNPLTSTPIGRQTNRSSFGRKISGQHSPLTASVEDKRSLKSTEEADLEAEEPDWVKSIKSVRPIVVASLSSGSTTSPVKPMIPEAASRPITIGPVTDCSSSDVFCSDITDGVGFSLDSRSLARRRQPSDSDIELNREQRHRIDDLVFAHAKAFATYCCYRESLSSFWNETLLQLASKIAFTLKPFADSAKMLSLGQSMDVCDRLHVKRLRDASVCTHVVFGTVFTKSICDKRMRHSIVNPKILLISSSLEFDREKQRLLSLDVILAQEGEYIRGLVSKIVETGATLVMFENSVTFTAQEQLFKHDITLLCNVKRSVLNRIAVCTDTSVVPCVESLISKPKLGKCGFFKCVPLESWTNKSICYIEDCPPNIECGLLLSGPSKRDLTAAKRVLKLLVSVYHTCKTEAAFLKSISALPRAATHTADETTSTTCDICAEQVLSAPDVDALMDSPLYSAVQRSFIHGSPFITTKLPFLEIQRARNSLLQNNGVIMNVCGNFQYKFDDAKVPPDRDLITLKEPTVEEIEPIQAKTDQIEEAALKELQNSKSYVNSMALVNARMTEPANSDSVQTMLAAYRAGGVNALKKRLRLTEKAIAKAIETEEVVNTSDAVESDVLNVYKQRRIAFLFASYSDKCGLTPSNMYCIYPWVVRMQICGELDEGLGEFLRQRCFNRNYRCPGEQCLLQPNRHLRRFVHGNVVVDLTVQQEVEKSSENTDVYQSNDTDVDAWTYCPLCKSNTATSKLTRDVLSLSFGTYLMYLFNATPFRSSTTTGPCPHCLFHEHWHYFAHQNAVACFRVSHMRLHDVRFPQRVCILHPRSLHLSEFITRNAKLVENGEMIFADMADHIDRCKGNEQLALLMTKLRDTLELQKQSWTEKEEKILKLFNSHQADDVLKEDTHDYIALNDVNLKMKRTLAESVARWNALIADSANHKKGLLRPSSNANELANTSAEPRKSMSDVFTNLINSSTETQCSVETPKMTSISPPLFSMPFPDEEHYNLPFGHVPVAVIEKEPSSVIAYALSSAAYAEKMRACRNALADSDTAVSLKQLSKRSFDDGSAEKSTPDPHQASHSNYHIEIQFADRSTRFYVKVYFAEHFRLLRKLVFPQGEDAFIRSLASCGLWSPKGGKSGATFFKTSDDRFILKQMSRFEVQSFPEFARSYFDYVATACSDDKQTALVKNVGMFRIVFHNQVTASRDKVDIFVMENLFYKRNISQVFDLKGSVRNRLASDKHSASEMVLLDENLLKTLRNSPLHVHPHSKAAIQQVMQDDSTFLAANDIMDYSLLVGLDGDTQDLVVGIIDYIRTYTLDKRLESVVKKGFGSQDPTILSPDNYAVRFCDAMRLYFQISPDQWFDLAEELQRC